MTSSQASCVDLFTERAREAGASVRRDLPVPAEGCYVSPRVQLASHSLGGPAPYDRSLADAGIDALTAVLLAEAAVAETGSILFAHVEADDLTALALARQLVILAPEPAIVADLDALVPTLDRLGADAVSWTLLTGPSRTADIERRLTIGVHGSVVLDVVIVS